MNDVKKVLVEKVCKKCEFYSESDENLECYAFKLTKRLVEKGKLNPDEL